MAEIQIKELNSNENLQEMYLKVVTGANDCPRKGFIKCPDCGEEILMIPTLRKMNEAIENHVKNHKEMLKDNTLLQQHTAIQIRLELAQQVLQKASDPTLF
ncbi:MAG: hypothetical protein NWE95_12670 [Candidatus Bathyarchaeota archaeon]|jgi:hypothetical protein|nr:hypothetical protein [Candidatus Bathyarchaeota archaeon]